MWWLGKRSWLAMALMSRYRPSLSLSTSRPWSTSMWGPRVMGDAGTDMGWPGDLLWICWMACTRKEGRAKEGKGGRKEGRKAGGEV